MKIKKCKSITISFVMAVLASTGCQKNKPVGEDVTTAEVEVRDTTTVADDETTTVADDETTTVADDETTAEAEKEETDNEFRSRLNIPDQEVPAGMVGDEKKDGWGWGGTGHGPYGAGDAAARNQSGLQEFKYTFGLGSYWSVKVDDQVTLEMYERAGVPSPYVDGTVELTDKEISEFNDIYIKHKLWRWDGYDRRAMVTDATGYTLTFQYKDGTETKVHGYCVYPEGWADFREDMNAWIEPLRDRIVAQTSEEDRIQYDDELILKIRDIVLQKITEDTPGEETVTCRVTRRGSIDIRGFSDPEKEFDYTDSDIADDICEQALGHSNHSMFILCPFHSIAYTETILTFTLDPSTGKWTVDIRNEVPGSRFRG